jgi:hypothetical protein
MGQKSKKRKAPTVPHPSPPVAYGGWTSVAPGPIPDFAEIERQAARREARREELRYRLAPDCKVHIQFNGIATQGAIRKLISYLEMAIGDFPENGGDSANTR